MAWARQQRLQLLLLLDLVLRFQCILEIAAAAAAAAASLLDL
jgi:hypothetical protein